MSIPRTIGSFEHTGGRNQTAVDVTMNPVPSYGIVSEAVRALSAATLGSSAADRGRSSRGTRARQIY